MAEKLHDDTQQVSEPASHDVGSDGSTISRRGFLKGMGTGAVTVAVAPAMLVTQMETAKAAVDELPGVTEMEIRLNINGKAHKVSVEARATLAAVLRDQLDITGSKVVCDRGECGACTLMLVGTKYRRIFLWKHPVQWPVGKVTS